MGTSAIKTIVLLIFLSVLAFVAGSLASEGAKQAVMPIGLVVGAVVLLCLGRHCWVLVFVVPPLYSLLGLPTVSKLPIVYVFATLLLVYWLFLYSLGRAQITWHKLPVFDSLVLLFCVYFLFTWVRNPVTLNLFVNPLTDTGHIMVGGAEYVWCVFAMLFYLFMSIVPVSISMLTKLFRVIFYISFLLLILSTAKGGGSGGAVVTQTSDFADQITETRYARFTDLGLTMCNALVCFYSVRSIVFSPVKMGLYIIGLLFIAMSGFRTHLLNVVLVMLFAQYIHRSIVSFFVMGVVAYGGLLMLASVGAFDGAPYGVLRVMSSVPGIDIENRTAAEAQHSLTWRYEMWEWAMNPSTGYIKDYTWGDGFGLDMYRAKQVRLAKSRGSYKTSNRDFAAVGMWHSGWITAIHRTGIVGLVILVVLQVAYIVYALRVCCWLRNVKYIGFMYYQLLPCVAWVFVYHISAGVFLHVFMNFYSFALMKILYSQAIKEGLMPPMFQRKVYVPLIQREIERGGC